MTQTIERPTNGHTPHQDTCDPERAKWQNTLRRFLEQVDGTPSRNVKAAECPAWCTSHSTTGGGTNGISHETETAFIETNPVAPQFVYDLGAPTWGQYSIGVYRMHTSIAAVGVPLVHLRCAETVDPLISPAEARILAAELLRAADLAESPEVKR